MRDRKIQPKAIILVVVAAIVVLVALTTVILTDDKQTPNGTPQSTSQTDQSQNQQTAPETISYDGVAGKTALELLKAEATVVTKTSSFGEYVDSINGVVGGTDGKYWAFYINGEMAQVGAGAYETKEGDKIEWKFE